MAPMDMIQPSDEIQRVSAQLAFLSQENWVDELGNRADTDSAEFFRAQLIDAAPGLGYCIDERMISPDDPQAGEPPKPAFVGGAAGWVVMYLMTGMSLPEAVSATVSLYEQNNWGEMEIHTDDHAEIGCGFLNVQQKVIETLKNLRVPGLSDTINMVEGKEIFAALKEAGAKVVTLTGAHKTNEAKVVVNQVGKTTLDRQMLYDQNPAFLWDAWATTGDTVRNSFNGLSGGNLDANNFMRLQAAMHLATGTFLNAVRLTGEEKNVVMLAK